MGTRTLPLWRPVPAPLLDHVGREVVLGLRAEDVHGAAAGHDPDAITLDAVVSDVEYTGRQNVVALIVSAPPVLAPGADLTAGSFSGATLHAFFPPRAVIRPGEVVQIAVEAGRAHVFDAVTGRALWHPEHGLGGERADDDADPPRPET